MTKKDQASEQKSNNAVTFRYIPENIGEIEFSETSNPKDKPNSLLKQVLTAIAIVVIAVYTGYMFYRGLGNHTGGDGKSEGLFYGLVALFLVYLYKKNIKFSGTDYFTGTEGFCFVTFNRKRENMKVETVLYEDIADIVEIQKDVRIRNGYKYTECGFTVIGKGGEMDVLAKGTGAYFNKNKLKLKLNLNYEKNMTMEQITGFTFWRRISGMMSETWYGEANAQLSRGESVQFDRYEKGRIVKGDIEVSRDFLRIGDKEIEREMVDDVKYKKDSKGDDDKIIIKYRDKRSGTQGEVQVELQKISRRKVFEKVFKDYMTL